MEQRKQWPGAGSSPEPSAGAASLDEDFDQDFAEWTKWLDRENAAGRNLAPPERTAGAQGISVSLGDHEGVDPELFAAICGADSDGLGSQFGQDAAADVLPPGPALAALTEAAVTEVAYLSDNQLIGVLQAARRQENREAWKKALVIAEFARRRQAEFDAATARGVPVHCRPGQFPGEELASELLLGPGSAAHAIDDAVDLATRLPRTLAGMAAGLIDESRAGVISVHTRSLAPDDAALADEILAALAPGLRLDQLMHKAAALEMKLNPEAVKARREHARRTRQRVEVRREESGNASVAGREMDTGKALASKAYIHSLALRLRREGLPGPLDQLRLAVFEDLTSGRDPMHRLSQRAAEPAAGHRADAEVPPRDPPDGVSSAGPPDFGVSSAGPVDPGVPPADPAELHPAASPGSAENAGRLLEGDRDGAIAPDDVQRAFLDYGHGENDSGDDLDAPVPVPGPGLPVPMPAMINLVVHAGTLFGWDTAPSEVGGWGLLDPDETRALVAAASQHPRTRWCLTLLGPDGTAAAHGCAPGQHPWFPEDQHSGSPGRQPPDPRQAERFAAFLRGLNVTPEGVARGSCDHGTAEPRYVPSRQLTHLIRARTATCDAPGCTAQAVHADLDHTKPYPDGPTCQCNLGPKCRRHHKAKQAPGWKAEQPEPGLLRWTLPNGRTHTTRPTDYLIKDPKPELRRLA